MMLIAGLVGRNDCGCFLKRHIFVVILIFDVIYCHYERCILTIERKT